MLLKYFKLGGLENPYSFIDTLKIEQKYLPVLPDKVMITESLPLTIRGNETRKFSFESLIKNAAIVDTKSLTVEFSSNPAWYAVQALPTIAEPANDNAIDLFKSKFYKCIHVFNSVIDYKQCNCDSGGGRI